MSYGCHLCHTCHHHIGDDWNGGCTKHWPAETSHNCSQHDNDCAQRKARGGPHPAEAADAAKENNDE